MSLGRREEDIIEERVSVGEYEEKGKGMILEGRKLNLGSREV